MGAASAAPKRSLSFKGMSLFGKEKAQSKYAVLFQDPADDPDE